MKFIKNSWIEIVSFIVFFVFALYLMNNDVNGFVKNVLTSFDMAMTIASIFIGLFGAMFGLIMAKDVNELFDNMIKNRIFNYYKWKVWESVIISFIVLIYSFLLKFISYAITVVILKYLYVLWFGLIGYFFVSVIIMMWFFIKAILDTQERNASLRTPADSYDKINKK
ncbi:hypothetical protein G7084_01420 [Weissella coleopterorum]|uniref:Uncharacterized protein n=1 Tax=Weissella coleopterorum TaxID=2714949 RepID=A0A6G8AYL5_9LACO|nr:hypothetical protein [Weissella coleopterorum]QIL50096.1 hypothetical protein G7084_01420 [Weissella coleopterorum]